MAIDENVNVDELENLTAPSIRSVKNQAAASSSGIKYYKYKNK